MSLSLRRGLRAASWNQRGRGLFGTKTWRSLHIQPARPEQDDVLNGSSNLPGSESISTATSPDARFEVLGAPYSLLSATLTPSQNLYTRRGTLVGLSGKADNVVSTLRVLEPVQRALLQIPFLYQKISSTSPVTVLLSTRSPTSSFAVVQLDGTVDWMVAQRQALLAWTGHSMKIKPIFNRKLSLAHWGNSKVTGRGLLALVGKGQVFLVSLNAGEQYIVHPSNVVAYTITSHPPQPYRFKSTTLRFQIPNLGLTSWLSRSNFIKNMAETETWRGAMRVWHTIRTWSRRTIWGDRLFLQFEGPTKILVQTRASRVNDVLTTEEVNEIASAPPGVTRDAVHTVEERTKDVSGTGPAAAPQMKEANVKQSFATVRRDGKVEFRQAEP
ncbi:hypothetical protein VTO42DRAFT_7551 [Malbranchea cinnamomea]